MATLTVTSSKGNPSTLDEAAVEEFGVGLRGVLLKPDDYGYEDSRRIWNAMIDRRPALIARCTGTADVIRSVNFARENDLTLAVKGVGHNIAGNAVCDGGMVIDLSSMRSVQVDLETRRAYVEPGATLGDVDHETQAFGLALPVGINSTTGVSGLTLGGGFGWLTRKYGMTVDNLVSADVVTADGSLLRASENRNPDLFWGIRGGGGNFGIVTGFEFGLHRLGPEVLSGLIVYPLDQGGKVLERYRRFVKDLPEELAVWCILRVAPPLPFLPPEVHGKGVAVLALCHAGDPEEGKKMVEPLRGFGDVLGEHVGVQPYAAWQQAFDPLLTPGARNYWKTHNFTGLENGLFDTMIGYAERFPSPQCEIFVAHIGGQPQRVAPDAMAYSHRDTEFVMNVHSRWDDPKDDAECIAWAREFFEATKPYASAGAYINFMSADEEDRVQSAFGAGYHRLVDIKNRYDPKNLFRFNQNIRPTI